MSENRVIIASMQQSEGGGDYDILQPENKSDRLCHKWQSLEDMQAYEHGLLTEEAVDAGNV